MANTFFAPAADRSLWIRQGQRLRTFAHQAGDRPDLLAHDAPQGIFATVPSVRNFCARARSSMLEAMVRKSRAEYEAFVRAVAKTVRPGSIIAGKRPRPSIPSRNSGHKPPSEN